MNTKKRLVGMAICLLNIALLCGCGSSGPGSPEQSGSAENWDEVTWDQDSWQ